MLINSLFTRPSIFNFLTLSTIYWTSNWQQVRCYYETWIRRVVTAAVHYGTCTRYIVRGVSARYSTAQISCGEYSGNILFILRIPLSPTDAGLPFILCRHQYHVRPAFAMTITRRKVRHYSVLVFCWTSQCSHGRRVMALWWPKQHQIFVQSGQTANVVYSEVLSCW